MPIDKEPRFTDAELVKMMDDYDKQCEIYFSNLFKNKKIRMDFKTFFCLTAKVRAAQKAYFAAKDTKAPDRNEKLQYSIKLENLLDIEIKKLLKFWQNEDLKPVWNEYLNKAFEPDNKQGTLSF